jgi:hypothetical protein
MLWPDSGPLVSSVFFIKVAIILKDREHIRYIFAFVQNTKGVAHTGRLEMSPHEGHDCLLLVAEFFAECHGWPPDVVRLLYPNDPAKNSQYMKNDRIGGC